MDIDDLKKLSAEWYCRAAIKTMNQRGKDYDKSRDDQEQERSMGATVKAFNAITRRDINDTGLSESEGWLILQLLKDVRQWATPNYHHDSAMDGVAYAALKAESLAKSEVEQVDVGPDKAKDDH
jgi:hypothetical protein